MTTGREPDRPATGVAAAAPRGRAASIRLRAPPVAWHAMGGAPPTGLGVAVGVDRMAALERQAVATRLRLDTIDDALGELRGTVAAVAARLDDVLPAGRAPSPDAARPPPDEAAPEAAEAADPPGGPSTWAALPAWARVVAAVDALLLAALLVAALAGRPGGTGPRAAAPLPAAGMAAGRP